MIKRLLRCSLFWVIVAEIIIGVVLWRFGFRITYGPDLEYDWEATSAVAEWFGVIVGTIVIPLVVVHLQHKWDADKQDVAGSNWEVIKELSRFKERFEPLLVNLDEGNIIIDGGTAWGCETAPPMSLEEKAMQYIAINMGATKPEISEYLNISLSEVSRIIGKLLNDGHIKAIGSTKNIKYKVINPKK